MDFIIPVIIAAAAIGGAAFYFLYWRNRKSASVSVVPVTTPEGTFLVPLDASKWTIEYSPGMPAHPTQEATGWSLNVPVGTETLGANSIHYITTPVNLNIDGKSSVEVGVKIECVGDPIFQYKLNPDNQGDKPANVSIILQRQGDDMTASKEYYRWWCEPSLVTLAAGEAIFTIPLSPSQWISVFGKPGTENPEEFKTTLQNLGNIGFTFGGGSFKGHGVNIDKGEAKFSVTSMEIK